MHDISILQSNHSDRLVKIHTFLRVGHFLSLILNLQKPGFGCLHEIFLICGLVNVVSCSNVQMCKFDSVRCKSDAVLYEMETIWTTIQFRTPGYQTEKHYRIRTVPKSVVVNFAVVGHRLRCIRCNVNSILSSVGRTLTLIRRLHVLLDCTLQLQLRLRMLLNMSQSPCSAYNKKKTVTRTSQQTQPRWKCGLCRFMKTGDKRRHHDIVVERDDSRYFERNLFHTDVPMLHWMCGWEKLFQLDCNLYQYIYVAMINVGICREAH